MTSEGVEPKLEPANLIANSLLFVTPPLYMEGYRTDIQLGVGAVINLSSSDLGETHHLQTEFWKIHPHYAAAQHHWQGGVTVQSSSCLRGNVMCRKSSEKPIHIT